MSPTDDVFYDTEGAVEFLCNLNLPISKIELERMRVKGIGGGPDFVRWRSKCVRYPRQALLDWAASNLRPGETAPWFVRDRQPAAA
jgi:hypothetical protein